MRRLLALVSVLALVVGLNMLGCGGGDDGNDAAGEEDVTIQNDTGNPEEDSTIPEDDTNKPEEDVDVCVPECDGLQCGPDGCGGTCGVCPNGVPCQNGLCVCTPACQGKQCGDDGCGGTCGTCTEAGATCVEGICTFCEPKCAGKECGPDTCGGSCGSCSNGEICLDTGLCGIEGPVNECPGIFDCINACDPTDTACQQNCMNEASMDAQMAFNGVIQCLDTNGYWDCAEGDDACLTEASNKCETELTACFHGNLTCAEMYNCLNSCPNDETGQECGSDCIGNGSIEGQAIWNDFIDCLDANGYFDCTEGDEACYQTAWDACQTEFEACIPPGTASCVEMYLCVIQCQDSACSQECLASGTSEAQGLWNDFINCIDSKGYFECAEGDDACMQAAWDQCNTEFTACAHGEKTCKEVFECLNACNPASEICPLECQVTGSVAAQEAFSLMVDCVVNECGEAGDAECQNNALTGNCASPYNDCLGN